MVRPFPQVSKAIANMTDARSCPFDSLPLQSVLQFEPPGRDEAVSYLSALCGQLDLVSTDNAAYARGLYDRSVVRQPGLVKRPGPPNGHEWLPYFDLRRAIMQLQLERGSQHIVVDSPDEDPSGDIRCLSQAIDARSFVDADLSRRDPAVTEVS